MMKAWNQTNRAHWINGSIFSSFKHFNIEYTFVGNKFAFEISNSRQWRSKLITQWCRYILSKFFKVKKILWNNINALNSWHNGIVFSKLNPVEMRSVTLWATPIKFSQHLFISITTSQHTLIYSLKLTSIFSFRTTVESVREEKIVISH